MKKVLLFPLVVLCCSWANAQEQTPADPFGLTAFGFKHKLDSRPLITPPNDPQHSRTCGPGVYLRYETVTVRNKAAKVKVVIVYFLPNPTTLSTFGADMDDLKPSPMRVLTNLPPGVSSLTFFWPPRLRREQSVLLMRAELISAGLRERTMNFPARLDVQEADSPSMFWKFDDYIPGTRAPHILGNLIISDPVLLKVTIPRGSKKCLEGK